MSPIWSWVVVGGIVLVSVNAAFVAARWLAADAEPQSPLLMEPVSSYEAQILLERDGEDAWRVTLIDSDGIAVLIAGLDHVSAHNFAEAFAGGMEYVVNREPE